MPSTTSETRVACIPRHQQSPKTTYLPSSSHPHPSQLYQNRSYTHELVWSPRNSRDPRDWNRIFSTITRIRHQQATCRTVIHGSWHSDWSRKWIWTTTYAAREKMGSSAWRRDSKCKGCVLPHDWVQVEVCSVGLAWIWIYLTRIMRPIQSTSMKRDQA